MEVWHTSYYTWIYSSRIRQQLHILHLLLLKWMFPVLQVLLFSTSILSQIILSSIPILSNKRTVWTSCLFKCGYLLLVHILNSIRRYSKDGLYQPFSCLMWYVFFDIWANFMVQCYLAVVLVSSLLCSEYAAGLTFLVIHSPMDL